MIYKRFTTSRGTIQKNYFEILTNADAANKSSNKKNEEQILVHFGWQTMLEKFIMITKDSFFFSKQEMKVE